LDDYVGALQSDGYSPGHISNCVKSVKTFFRVNDPRLELPYKLHKYVVSRDRAPTPEEIGRLLDLADLRGKVIVSMLALAGFRVGTLCKLQYRHVRQDLERNVVPVHVHVEAQITKGKYHDYDTFIGREAVEFLKAYFDARRKGGLPNTIPPENLCDSSPIIRDEHSKSVKPITPSQVYNIIHRLMAQAGLLGSKVGRRYSMRPHSIRKFFRTQMAALGVSTDYIEYMMGHTISTYHDIRMKGIEFLRARYAAAGLRIKQKEKADIYDFVEDVLKSKGYSIDRQLLRRAIIEPHRTSVGPKDYREERKTVIRDEFMKMLRKELLDTKTV